MPRLLARFVRKGYGIMDLTTTYMGLTLKNPIVPSASPLSENLDNIKRMADAGASAVVMFSLFEEQLKQEGDALNHFMHYGADSFAESLSYFPQPDEYEVGPDRYLDLIHKASQAVDIPIIASLNGISNDGWVKFATKAEQAGAKGIELNQFYIPTDLDREGTAIEDLYVDVVRAVKGSVKVPVAVKMSPFFSSMANMAKRLEGAGADALVLFNRFYQPDFDLEKMEVVPTLQLSDAGEIRLPLLWISVLHGRIRPSLAASRGVHSAQEVVKYLLAGADVVMTTSAMLKRGIGFLGVLQRDLRQWMEEHEYDSVREMRGAMSQRHVPNPNVFERANYIKMLKRFEVPTLS